MKLRELHIERFHQLMTKVPHWIFSIICLAIILWLTLAPHPFGEEELPLFPGADKLAHGLMFFGLTLCMLFDYMRHNDWHHVALPVIGVISLFSMCLGIGIEFLQKEMDAGRGFEVLDMACDAIGAIVAGALWVLAGGFLEQTKDEVKKMEAFRKNKESSGAKGNSQKS